MTRSRAKRQQARQVKILIEVDLSHKNVLFIGIHMMIIHEDDGDGYL